MRYYNVRVRGDFRPEDFIIECEPEAIPDIIRFPDGSMLAFHGHRNVLTGDYGTILQYRRAIVMDWKLLPQPVNLPKMFQSNFTRLEITEYEFARWLKHAKCIDNWQSVRDSNVWFGPDGSAVAICYYPGNGLECEYWWRNDRLRPEMVRWVSDYAELAERHNWMEEGYQLLLPQMQNVSLSLLRTRRDRATRMLDGEQDNGSTPLWKLSAMRAWLNAEIARRIPVDVEEL